MFGIQWKNLEILLKKIILKHNPNIKLFYKIKLNNFLPKINCFL